MIESLGKVCAEYGLMAITQEYDEDEDEGARETSFDGGDEKDVVAMHSASSIADLQKLARTHAIYKESEGGIYALRKRRQKARPRRSHGSNQDSSDAGSALPLSPGYSSSDGNAYTSGGASDSDDGTARAVSYTHLTLPTKA